MLIIRLVIIININQDNLIGIFYHVRIIQLFSVGGQFSFSSFSRIRNFLRMVGFN